MHRHILLCNMSCVGEEEKQFLEAERRRLRTEMLVAGKQEAERANIQALQTVGRVINGGCWESMWMVN